MTFRSRVGLPREQRLPLPGGTYQVSAHYAGSSSFVDSDSNAIPVTVGAESSTTSLKVTRIRPVIGQTFLPRHITDSSTSWMRSLMGTARPREARMEWPRARSPSKMAVQPLGSAALDSSGTAEEQTTVIPGGGNSLTAIFPGDASFLASTSAPFALTVVPALTTFGTPSLQPGPLGPGRHLSNDRRHQSRPDSVGTAPTGNVTFENGINGFGDWSSLLV